jgi:hypothetical protein
MKTASRGFTGACTDAAPFAGRSGSIRRKRSLRSIRRPSNSQQTPEKKPVQGKPPAAEAARADEAEKRKSARRSTGARFFYGRWKPRK